MSPVVKEPPERRSAPRAAVDFAVTLSRSRGGPIRGHTLELGRGGAVVTVQRPLRVYELLQFDLSLGDPGPAVSGHARVLREHAAGAYALRFDDLTPDGAEALSAFLEPEPSS